MIHATAAVAIAAIAQHMPRPRAWLGLAGFMLAAVSLFGGDIALHTLTGAHVFPMAAPTGGSLLIGSWLGVALLAAVEWRSGK